MGMPSLFVCGACTVRGGSFATRFRIMRRLAIRSVIVAMGMSILMKRCFTLHGHVAVSMTFAVLMGMLLMRRQGHHTQAMPIDHLATMPGSADH